MNMQFFSESGKANTALPLFWANTTQKWLQVAAHLEIRCRYSLITI